MPQPARRRVLGRPQMVEDRDHIGKGGGEVSPAGNAHQAHGAPIDQDREESQEILDLTPLEQTSQEEDRHAEPFQVLPDRRQLFVAGAQDRLVTIGVAVTPQLLDSVGQGDLLLLGALDRAQLGPMSIGVAVRVEATIRIAGAHRDRETGEAGDNLRHRTIITLQSTAIATGEVLLAEPGYVEG